MRRLIQVAAALAALVMSGAQAAEPVRVGVLKFGTVNWELNTLRHHGLDARHGIAVEVVPLASKNATAVALQGGSADIIVTDWIWVSRQRASARPYVFVPYSMAVGALLARPDAGIRSVADLKGKRLGVAGGPVDKSWLLLRSFGLQSFGRDVADEVDVSFVAPPLLNKLLLRGDLDAGLNFWHYGARLRAAGMHDVVGVRDMLRELGVDQPLALLGWVFEEGWAAANRKRVMAFLRASYDAKRLLMTDDDEWVRLAPLMKAADDAARDALRDAYRAGVPRAFGDAEVAGAAKAFEILAKLGGEKLTGGAKHLAPGTFWREFELPR